jgi:hypothetical protein
MLMNTTTTGSDILLALVTGDKYYACEKYPSHFGKKL